MYYYKFDPISDVAPKEKTEILSIRSFTKTMLFSEIVFTMVIEEFLLPNQFLKFETAEVPEANSYVSTSSSITYNRLHSHNWSNLYCRWNSAGKNYTTLPSILSINSDQGVNADLVASSKNIGTIEKVKLNDIGYDFPSDATLKPSASLPQIINVDTFAKIDNIEITSGGRVILLHLIWFLTAKPVVKSQISQLHS